MLGDDLSILNEIVTVSMLFVVYHYDIHRIAVTISLSIDRSSSSIKGL